MPMITSVELRLRFMPDMIELDVNGETIFRAKGDDDTLRIAQRMEHYFLRKGDEQHAMI
jgi:hypothetical protein